MARLFLSWKVLCFLFVARSGDGISHIMMAHCSFSLYMHVAGGHKSSPKTLRSRRVTLFGLWEILQSRTLHMYAAVFNVPKITHGTVLPSDFSIAYLIWLVRAQDWCHFSCDLD